ncbi:MAG: hypothetical protein H6558_15600 [Lewinellaceae bacterium]|nr:hypothetical protein [Lewinellaceae bacterium]MCB9291512.1 hypothetical protein [Lewinellaceae bacterium]
MASISSQVLDIPPRITLGGDFTVEVSYRVRFSLLERLLATQGLGFREFIWLYDVDYSEDNPDDYLARFPDVYITPEEIAAAPSTGITRTRTERFSPSELTGPDDDGSPFRESVQARVVLSPSPMNATQFKEDDKRTNVVVVNTEVPDIETAPFSG